jgi:hypothetical protein
MTIPFTPLKSVRDTGWQSRARKRTGSAMKKKVHWCQYNWLTATHAILALLFLSTKGGLSGMPYFNKQKRIAVRSHICFSCCKFQTLLRLSGTNKKRYPRCKQTCHKINNLVLWLKKKVVHFHQFNGQFSLTNRKYVNLYLLRQQFFSFFFFLVPERKRGTIIFACVRPSVRPFPVCFLPIAANPTNRFRPNSMYSMSTVCREH